MAQAGGAAVPPPRSQLPSVAGIGVVDALAALTLTGLMVVTVHVDLYPSDPHGGLLAVAAATSMTLPVLWARRYPLAAAATVAAGGLVNWLFVGEYIRCGAAVPAAFWLACAVGLRLSGRRATSALVLVLVGLQAMCLADAELIAASVIPLGLMVLAFWLIGRTIRSRSETNRRVAAQNAELAATREKTAQIAINSDRLRISATLDRQLQQNLAELEATALAGREQVDNPPSAQAAFAVIAHRGRRTLAEMREVVDAVHVDAVHVDAAHVDAVHVDAISQPAAGLSRLGDLVTRYGGRLEVQGVPRPLPEHLEVSGYRVVEQLLRTFDRGSAPGDVQVEFGTDALVLRVSGTPTSPVVTGPEVTLVRQSVERHGGGLSLDHRADHLQWVARVPLVAG
jgi:hypothetical protein